jgi:multisubunit Na+/H+ antiporter MnhE subunit
VTGVLLRAWWSVTYILILGFVLTILKLALTDEYPGSDSDVITLAFAIILVPLLMIGAAVGMVIGKLVERG